MEDHQNKRNSMFGNYGAMDPSMNVPLTSSPNSITSPYLNFDPAYLNPAGESQYLFPEGANQRRGRFELAFSQIGGSALVGGAAGGVNGIYSGIKSTKAEALTGAVRRTQMLNVVGKQGASSAQTLGVIALMYSIFGVVLSKARGAEDELNTLTAATATGLLYKSSAGLKPCLRAGGVGFGLASAYCLITSRDRVKQMMGID